MKTRFVRVRASHGLALARLERLVYLQVIAGIINLALLAPLWMQLVHLLLADAVWIAFVLGAVETLAVRRPVSA